MCQDCIENEKELREFFQDKLYAAYADPDLAASEKDIELVLGAVTWALDHPDDVHLDEEQMELLLAASERLKAAETPEEQLDLARQVNELLVGQLSERITGLTDIDQDILGRPTEQTLIEDQLAMPDEIVAEKLVRGIQHHYYYHEGRPQYLYHLLGRDLIDSIGNRMMGYARHGMNTLPQFGSALLVLQEDGAIDALQMMMMAAYMEALIAGYYAGSTGQDCIMAVTHELGPVGRMDDRSGEEKLAEALPLFAAAGDFDEHGRRKTDG